MDKVYQQTQLQVIISPALLLTRDNIKRPASQQHLSEGHVALSGLQMRGGFMLSSLPPLSPPLSPSAATALCTSPLCTVATTALHLDSHTFSSMLLFSTLIDSPECSSRSQLPPYKT